VPRPTIDGQGRPTRGQWADGPQPTGVAGRRHGDSRRTEPDAASGRGPEPQVRGDLAAPLRPLATQPGRDAGDFPLLVAALPADTEPAGQSSA
jgi:hypothetical protein